MMAYASKKLASPSRSRTQQRGLIRILVDQLLKLLQTSAFCGGRTDEVRLHSGRPDSAVLRAGGAFRGQCQLNSTTKSCAMSLSFAVSLMDSSCVCAGSGVQFSSLLGGWGESALATRLACSRIDSRCAATQRKAYYPRTLIFENDSTARPEVGRPIDKAGRKVVKISILFTWGNTSLDSSGSERMR